MIDLSMLKDFIAEAAEHIEEMEGRVLQLETDPGNKEVLNDIFRSVHTIKGSAEYLGMEKIARLCHKLENVLDMLRHGEMTLDRDGIDLLMAARDRIATLIGDLERVQAEETEVEDIIGSIDQLSADQVNLAPDYPETHDAAEDDVASSPETGPSSAVPRADETAHLSGSRSTDGPDEETEEDEIYEEEYDKELFGIFLEQLKEDLSFLSYQADELDHSDNRAEILDKCLDCVDRLRSSANYMDYGKLTRLYETWHAEIKKAKEDLSQGQDISFGFMDDHIDRISNLFPQIELKAEYDKAEVPKDADSVEIPQADEDELELSLDAEQDLSQGQDISFGFIDDHIDRIPNLFPQTKEIEAEHDKAEVPKDADSVEIPQADEDELELHPDARILSDGDEDANEPEKESGVQKNPPDKHEFGGLAEKIGKQSLRVDAEKIDHLMNQTSELITARAYFSQLFTDMRKYEQRLIDSVKLHQRDVKQFKDFSLRLSEATVVLSRVANEVQEGVMKIRMLPISQLFNRYPRLVRDLVRGIGKDVHLEIKGEETELDKVVIENLSDPLIHLIRNAVDHGIETVKARQSLGKPETGTIKLKAYHESNHVVIEIVDDGKGLDIDRIKATALKMDLVSEEELNRMGFKELMSLIMQPGFSTAAGHVTKTSGRGVGMDVVRKNIEKLNGTIEIESKTGAGTFIRIKIPLTLAIIQALLVRVGQEIFTIPLTAVEETFRIFDGDTSLVEGVEVIHLRESTLPLLRLSQMFNITASSQYKAFVVVVTAGTRRVGLVVDTLIGQEETVIKPLEDYLQEGSGFSGATILGNGRISLILDIYKLVSMAIARQRKRMNQMTFLGASIKSVAPETADVHEHMTIH